MRFPAYSLRTRILSSLTILIISAMLLINVVMMKFSERDLVQAKISTGRVLTRALGLNMGAGVVPTRRDMARQDSAVRFSRMVGQLLSTGGFSQALIINNRGNPVFSTGLSPKGREQGLSLAREALERGKGSVHFSGRTWGVLWPAHRTLWVSEPILIDGRTLGVVTTAAPLAPIYKTLRKSEKVILLYILMDTLILVLVGISLLSRVVVKPIHKLLKMTEEYKEGDISHLVSETSRNEIGSLSRSMSIMLKRLDENKKELKAHISSLEKANRSLKQAQNEIVRSEKLASVGRLAAGVSHEIGNPLGIILGYLGLIKKEDIADEEREDFLHRIETEVTRINQIIRQLLDFSRSSSGRPKKTHTHELILNTLDILKPQPMMEEIRVTPVLSASRDTVFTEPNQLQQVFLNIIMNVADAFSGNASSENQNSTKELVINSENIEKGIELRFTDNGPGIPEEELTRIFDPFYTTKEPGKGTGLGLYVCYRIVEDLKGAIRVESSPGKGTSVIVVLPNCDENEGD